mmetsp:Transcript_38126/g.64905  ORF Transcript_38126/g.64905 Transcript_38126/m.64905 type:complete len:227 (-) Transcript_38126:194-874(-)
MASISAAETTAAFSSSRFTPRSLPHQSAWRTTRSRTAVDTPRLFSAARFTTPEPSGRGCGGTTTTWLKRRRCSRRRAWTSSTTTAKLRRWSPTTSRSSKSALELKLPSCRLAPPWWRQWCLVERCRRSLSPWALGLCRLTVSSVRTSLPRLTRSLWLRPGALTSCQTALSAGPTSSYAGRAQTWTPEVNPANLARALAPSTGRRKWSWSMKKSLCNLLSNVGTAES